MTFDVSNSTSRLADWLSSAVDRFKELAGGSNGFDEAILAADRTEVTFRHDPATTRISDESSAGQRTTYSATTEVEVEVPGHTSGPIPVTYSADLQKASATPAAMQALNPFDLDTIPAGGVIQLAGGDYAGTPFESTFRELAQANDTTLEDVRLVLQKTREGELRAMSGAADVFAAPELHGPASQPLDRQDFSLHTLLLRKPDSPDQRAALHELLLTGTLPDGTVGLSETVSPGAVEALVTDVGSGETNQVTWEFDQEGRPVRAEATLTWEPGSGGRTSDLVEAKAQSDFRTDHELKGTGDHVGHILAYRFVNGHGSVNMFPQDGNLNTGAYARLENEWSDWLAKGMDLEIRIELGPEGAARPDQVQVEYSVTDPATGKLVYDPQVTIFDNQAGQVYDRIASKDMDDMISSVS